VCNAGYYGPGGDLCTTCDAGSWCPGGAIITACPANTTSAAGSDAVTDCVCNAGYYGPGRDSCATCDAGSWCPGGATITACPPYTISHPGSTSLAACECAPGFTGDAASGVSCAPCAAGSYKDAAGPGACSACPSGAVSPEGSTSASSCVVCPGPVADSGECIALPEAPGVLLDGAALLNCDLNATWSDLIKRRRVGGTPDFEYGGLGPLARLPRFGVWLCEDGHACAGGVDFFCFVFDEVTAPRAACERTRPAARARLTCGLVSRAVGLGQLQL
jgi:hypothetical protein